MGATTSALRVLIIDDSDSTRLILNTIFCRVPGIAKVDEAVDGLDGLARVRQAYEKKLPYHLITLDLEMPDFDGRDFISFLRRHESDCAEEDPVRVLLVSAANDNKAIVDMMRYGCSGYLRKPFNSQDISLKLKEWFGLGAP